LVIAGPIPVGCDAKLSVMNVTKLKQRCRRFAGAVETLHGHPSNILVYAVGGKTFAYFKTSEPERWRFSFRVTPSRFLELTDMPGVKPARYMGRFHWVTIVRVDEFPSAYLVELVEASYRRALGSLSKAKQLAIAGEAAKGT
jgi:predicted DNA-binding protein (MmcQ/YjbR family)